MLASAPSLPGSGTLETLATDLCVACDAYQADPRDSARLARVWDLRLSLARAVLALPAKAKAGDDVLGLAGVVEKMIQTGVLDQAPIPAASALLPTCSPKAWNGIVAAMLVSPSWNWREAPSLDAVANWLWPLFTRYLFHVPQSFTAVGEAERYASHHLRRLRELEHWASANRGASVVKVALDTYLANSNCIPLYFSEGDLKQHYELRARVLAIALNSPRQADLPPFPREGRRLRVGFVKMHWGPQTETYSTMPTFEQLDKERFEVVLYALNEGGSSVEQYLRSLVSEFSLLPASLDERVQTLLAANLDVLVFATNVTAVTNDIVLLALHRLAPLQVMHHPSCTTTGLPEIDLYVSGVLTESEKSPAQFTERLGLIPGPSHAFNYQVDAQDPSHAPTREMLGVGEKDVLFVSGANYYKIIPEMMHCWAKLLVSVPGSKLLVHPFNPNWSSQYPIDRFCAEFDRVMADHGVSSDRLIISTAKYPSRTDVKLLFGLGTVYLDTFPFSGVNSLIDPLECGVPPVAWEGDTFRARMASALLKEMQLPELIVRDEAAYLALCQRLATDTAFREGLQARIRDCMERTPLFMNSLASSDAFGGLMEKAYDELVSVGRKKFRSTRTPVQVAFANLEDALAEAETSLQIGMAGQAWDRLQSALAAHPGHPRLARAAGRALTALGRADRGCLYLLEAIQHLDPDPVLWCELAESFLHSGNLKNAVEAVQACLQLDGKNVEAILLLGEIADRGGQLDQIGDAVAIAQSIAPNDPRVAALAIKVQQATPSTTLQ
ncbi:hypothetical protein [Nibricoccus sp. IMCC34717]|uniref:tetratricopeptide repeat protein n=1 Tax=Nibricoccus sp. IMCC34717 TaxID=3034021 RepID=UPI003850565A